MKIGLVSYTYHRFLGEPYIPPQVETNERWTMLDVVKKVAGFGLDGIVLDTANMPSLDRGFLKELASAMDDAKLERAVSWGNPNGLNTGKSPEVVDDLIEHMKVMDLIGSKVLRIVGGSKRTAHEPHGPALERLAQVITDRCLRPAEDLGIVLAFENHWDYTADEVLWLLNRVGSDTLKVTYDSGNALRVGDDPVEAARKLAPYVVCTNLKDIGHPICDATDWRAEFPCVPFGRGRIDIAAISRILAEANSSSLHAIEMDRPREDFLDEDLYVAECVGYMNAVKSMLVAPGKSRT